MAASQQHILLAQNYTGWQTADSRQSIQKYVHTYISLATCAAVALGMIVGLGWAASLFLMICAPP